MKLYKISDLKLIEHITVLAQNNSDAADLFIASWTRGFGKVPVIEYAVTRWKPKMLGIEGSLNPIVETGERGFVWESKTGWDFVDPFAD